MSSTLDICRTATNKFDGIEVFFDLNEDILFLFSGECAQDRENVKDMMKDCMRRINSELILDVFIAMGSEEQNFSTVHNSYTHAKSLMDYMLVYDGNCLVDYHEKQIISSNYLKYLYMPSGYLEKLVVSGKPEDCDRFVEQTYDRIFSHPDIAPEAVQSITIELLYSIIHLLSEKRVRQRDLPEFNQDPYKKVYTIRNKTELVDWMKATVQQVRAALKNEQEHVSPVVKRAQDYININYEKDISLKLLSSMWSVNASYLGQQFKIATGEMFSVYLNKVRIEKAQQLLLETKLNANEIGVKVGYPNSNYFYNCFKKMTGKFPTEYRKDLFAN